jgi:hypothetical protein
MPGTDRDALVRDLAMVLRGALHPDAKVGPAPRLAARRLRDALGITEDARTEDVAGTLCDALFPVELGEPGELAEDSEDDLDRALHQAAQADGASAEADAHELFGG